MLFRTGTPNTNDIYDNRHTSRPGLLGEDVPELAARFEERLVAQHATFDHLINLLV
jgi:hypothetical protein